MILEHEAIPALVGDIGATKSLLAVAVLSRGGVHLHTTSVARLESRAYPHLSQLVHHYLADQPGLRPRWVCLGVPGPVVGGRCRTTNLPWELDARLLAQSWRVEGVLLLNDLAALGWSLTGPSLPSVQTLKPGTAEPSAPKLVAAAGTGLGAAQVVPTTAGPAVLASEAGHCDFAPQTPEDWELATWLRNEEGSASYEQVVSGAGLARLYRFFSRENVAFGFSAALDRGAWVVQHADEDPHCARAVEACSRYLGRFLGDLALVTLPLGGVFLGGSVAAALAPWMGQAPFADAFQDKGPQRELLARIPVFLLKDPLAALRGCGEALWRALEAGLSPGSP